MKVHNMSYYYYLLSCIALFFLVRMYLERIHKRLYKNKVVYSLAYIGCTFGLAGINTINKPLINLFSSICLILLLEKFFYCVHSKRQYLYSMLFIICGGLIEEFVFGFTLWIGTIFNINSIKFKYIGIILASFVVIIFYKLCLNWFINKDIEYLKKECGILGSIVVIFSIYLSYILMCLFLYISKNSIKICIIIALIGLFFLTFFILKIYKNIAKTNKQIIQYEVLVEKEKMNYQYYQKLEQDYHNNRKLMHDMKNHLVALERLYQLNPDSCEQYTKRIYDIIEKNKIIKYCSSKIVNIILNEKKNNANEKGILLEINIEDISLEFLSEFDIVTILGNLLDNAIDSCDKDEKIVLCLKKVNRMIVLNVKNPYSGKINVKNGKYVTTKLGHNGIGLSNVKDIVKKYNAEINIYTENSVFEVNIVFNN